MIKLDTLKQLVQLMVDNDLTEMDLQDEQESVSLRRGGQASGPVMYAAAPAHVPASSHAAAPAAPAGGGSAPAPAAGADEGLIAIESPMVGTFYSAASPDSPPFIKPGSQVTADSVVCIIEAMKVFNEIKAETSGTVERILVKNGEPVEFGQKLFLVRPS
ncbi:MAG: acetyl-CoA carboxylase biotin carboxyl carrier protein [Phycisphaerales bacterium]